MSLAIDDVRVVEQKPFGCGAGGISLYFYFYCALPRAFPVDTPEPSQSIRPSVPHRRGGEERGRGYKPDNGDKGHNRNKGDHVAWHQNRVRGRGYIFLICFFFVLLCFLPRRVPRSIKIKIGSGGNWVRGPTRTSSVGRPSLNGRGGGRKRPLNANT